MSRTTRNTKHANMNARNVAHYNYRRNELAALEEMIDLDYNVSNRQRSAQSRIANNYNDYNVAGYKEVKNKEEY